MKKYSCKKCGRVLFEGFFSGIISIVCRKCKTKNVYKNQ